MKTFGNIHNHIYANDGLSPQDAVNELVNLLFLKLIDEENNSQRFSISETEFALIKEGTQTDFQQRIERYFYEVKKAYPDLFENSDFLHLKPSTIAFIVKELTVYQFKSLKSDVKGVAFQKFLRSQFRVDRGQFLTPDPIIQLIVEILCLKEDEKVLDPCCGTAGFLVEGLRYIRRTKKDSTDLKNFSSNFFGRDVNPFILRLAKMRFLLEGGDVQNLSCMDSLQDLNEFNSLKSEDQSMNHSFDVVITNPPFGNQGKIKNQSILKNYQLGHKWVQKNGIFVQTDKVLSSQIPDILFIERCLDLLKEGGRLGIVLPDGILENKTLHYVRDFIKKAAKIIAVVSLPVQTFIPFGTGVKASVLILQKISFPLLKEQDLDYPIFFGIINYVGYIGNKNATPEYQQDSSGKALTDSTGNPLLKEDISKIISLFSQLKDDQALDYNELVNIIRFSDLEDRINAEYYQRKYLDLLQHLNTLKTSPLCEKVTIVKTKAPILQNPEEKIRYVEIGDVDPTLSEIVRSTEMHVFEAPSRASYELQEGDIITAVAGVSTGTSMHATAYVTKEFDRYICTNGFRILRPNNIDPFYLLVFLKSELFLQQMFRFRTGAAIPAVSDSDLERVLIPHVPADQEQKISEKMKSVYKLRQKAHEISSDVINQMRDVISRNDPIV